MRIRQAHQSDLGQLLGLMHELGYDIPESDLRTQVHIYINANHSLLLVSEADGHLAGLIAGHLIPLLHQPGHVGRITALVVSADTRDSGVGSALLEALEAWFNEQRCLRFEVTSGDHREGAHLFYQSQGYHPDERRFIKR